MRRITPPLVSMDVAILLAALAWWRITYGKVVGTDYLSWGDAGVCLVGNADICALAKSLCLGAQPRQLAAYWSSAFWIGFAVLSGGLLTAGRAGGSNDSDLQADPGPASPRGSVQRRDTSASSGASASSGPEGRDANRTYRGLRVITACLSRPAGLEDFWVTASAMVPLTRWPHYLVALRPG
jgi:hypothetical protein